MRGASCKRGDGSDSWMCFGGRRELLALCINQVGLMNDVKHVVLGVADS